MAKKAKRRNVQTSRVETVKEIQAQHRKDLQRRLREQRRIAAMTKQLERAVLKSHTSLKALRDFLVVWLVDADTLLKAGTLDTTRPSRRVLAAGEADEIFGTGTEG